MNINKWIKNNTASLEGKTVAVTGSTGGIGKELCRYLLSLNAKLVLIDRNQKRSEDLEKELKSEFTNASISRFTADMSNQDSIKQVCEQLQHLPIDTLILNAGAYSIPRHTCNTGFDNVFQINFVSPYYMVRELLPTLRKQNGKVTVVGSIAHNYSKTDPKDVDFSGKSKASLVYGNAKRYLMFSLIELFKNETDVSLAVTHPGITFTNITAHYPKLIFAIIKYPMKIIFMKPKKACLSILFGLFSKCDGKEWIGPCVFNIWGYPKKQPLKTCDEAESARIFAVAEEIYTRIR